MTVAIVTAGDWLGQDDTFCAWLIEQGIEPTDTYCVEIKDDKATIYQYKLNKDGEKHVICDLCGMSIGGTYATDHRKVCSGEAIVAKKDPFTVDIEGPIPGITEVN